MTSSLICAMGCCGDNVLHALQSPLLDFMTRAPHRGDGRQQRSALPSKPSDPLLQSRRSLVLTSYTVSPSPGISQAYHTPPLLSRLFYFIFASKRRKKIEKGGSHHPRNCYSSSSSTPESKQSLESTFVKRQLLQGRKMAVDINNTWGPSTSRPCPSRPWFLGFPTTGPRSHFPEFSSLCLRD